MSVLLFLRAVIGAQSNHLAVADRNTCEAVPDVKDIGRQLAWQKSFHVLALLPETLSDGFLFNRDCCIHILCMQVPGTSLSGHRTVAFVINAIIRTEKFLGFLHIVFAMHFAIWQAGLLYDAVLSVSQIQNSIR
jgi:hypothetical protein